jgi:hypothetical protein
MISTCGNHAVSAETRKLALDYFPAPSTLRQGPWFVIFV